MPGFCGSLNHSDERSLRLVVSGLGVPEAGLVMVSPAAHTFRCVVSSVKRRMFARHRSLCNVCSCKQSTTMIQRHPGRNLIRCRTNKNGAAAIAGGSPDWGGKCMASVQIHDVRKSFGGFEVL